MELLLNIVYCGDIMDMFVTEITYVSQLFRHTLQISQMYAIKIPHMRVWKYLLMSMTFPCISLALLLLWLLRHNHVLRHCILFNPYLYLYFILYIKKRIFIAKDLFDCKCMRCKCMFSLCNTAIIAQVAQHRHLSEVSWLLFVGTWSSPVPVI